MRRGRIFLLLILILVIAVGAFIVLSGSLTGAPEPVEQLPTPTPVITTVDVVVVAQKVPRGQALTTDVLGVVPIQQELLIPGMVTNMEEVLGKRARTDLYPGIPLYTEMIAGMDGDLATVGSDWALLIPRGMVAVSVPVSRLSAVSYAPRRGDHVNVIVTMMFVDLDASFQSILPNSSGAVIGPGPGFLIGLGESQVSAIGTTDQTGQAMLESTQQRTYSAQLANLGEFGSTLNAQVVSGGAASALGRSEVDPALEQTLYVVPSEPQRPRLVSQTLVQDVVVLQVGNFLTEADEQYKKEIEKAAELSAQATPDPNTEETPAIQEQTSVPQAPRPPDVITLIVSPQDAVTLNYLIYSGAQLTMALRPVNDDSRVLTEAVTLRYLMEVYNIPNPVKLPYGMQPRVDDLITPTLPNDQIPTGEEY